MITTKLIGGLGNQMFQYAFGRRTAHANKTYLKLDISGYKNQGDMTKREYELDCFRLNANFASEDDMNNFIKRNKMIRFSSRLFSYLKPYYKRSHIIEKQFNFDKNLLKIPDNSYLEGYWASDKYFKDIENIIRKDFTFRYQPEGKNKIICSKISSCNSVSIHVRRTDYVSDKKTNKVHGICSMEYYRKSISYISKKIKKPNFYFFSDDPAWVKQNFAIDSPCTYIDHNSDSKAYEDLRLMSSCKHNIIANSTFSWWAAWLNNNPDKIVIAPKKWFNVKSINTNDLYPEKWLKF